MASNITLRPAVPSDLEDMLAVFYSAFVNSILKKRSFPDSDPASHEYNVKHFGNMITDDISDVVVAEDHSGQKPSVAGWARWAKRPARDELPPRPVFTPDMYPAGGDGEYAARLYQANTDATREVAGVQAHWLLSIMLVRKEAQRKGVGSLLMRYGTERADRDECMAFVNSSREGKPLYEKHGFYTVRATEYKESGEITYHMKRDARKGDA